MSLIIETDIGRDPDDFFALLYLIGAGEDIRAISVTPGDRDQIAVVKFLLSELGLSIPVGSARPDRQKSSSGGIHVKLLERYGYPAAQEPDGSGLEVLQSAFSHMPHADLFVCGPLQATGDFLRAGGWGTELSEFGSQIAVDIDHEMLWDVIANFR